MLRAFRDGVLAHMPGEQEEIEEYYEIAPDIVAAINQRKDATQVCKASSYIDSIQVCLFFWIPVFQVLWISIA